jgi:hypothetical protein
MHAPNPQFNRTFEVVLVRQYKEDKATALIDLYKPIYPTYVTHLTFFYARKLAGLAFGTDPQQVELREVKDGEVLPPLRDMFFETSEGELEHKLYGVPTADPVTPVKKKSPKKKGRKR